MPISVTSSDINENIVTPSALITGRDSEIFPAYHSNKNFEIPTLNTRKEVIKELKLKDKLQGQFLRQFYNDYIDTLQKYKFKDKICRQLKVDDICLINDEKLSTNGRYAIGRITSLTYSKLDNLARTATLKIPASKTTKEKYVSRDIRKLCLLELNDSETSDSAFQET